MRVLQYNLIQDVTSVPTVVGCVARHVIQHNVNLVIIVVFFISSTYLCP